MGVENFNFASNIIMDVVIVSWCLILNDKNDFKRTVPLFVAEKLPKIFLVGIWIWVAIIYFAVWCETSLIVMRLGKLGLFALILFGCTYTCYIGYYDHIIAFNDDAHFCRIFTCLYAYFIIL